VFRNTPYRGDIWLPSRRGQVRREAVRACVGERGSGVGGTARGVPGVASPWLTRWASVLPLSFPPPPFWAADPQWRRSG
jgi:hypothetical protein